MADTIRLTDEDAHQDLVAFNTAHDYILPSSPLAAIIPMMQEGSGLLRRVLARPHCGASGTEAAAAGRPVPVVRSLDDVVRPREQRGRDRQAEGEASTRQRSVTRLHRDELMIRAFGDVVPGTHQRLEFAEGRVPLLGQGTLPGPPPDDLARQLLEIAQHLRRELDHLDCILELGLEPLERERVLRVELRETVNLDGGSRMVHYPPQIGRKALVCPLVEAELERGAGAVPA